MTNNLNARRIWAAASLTFACSLAWLLPAHAQQTLLDDEFNGTSISSSTWNTYGSGYFLQRTQFGGQPFIAKDSDGTSYARLPLATYNSNPTFGATDVLGTELFSNQSFPLGTGIQFEARLRGENLPKGLVIAFYGFDQNGAYPTASQAYEIDDELLTNQLPAGIWTNIWNMYNPSDPYNDGFHNQDGNPTATGANWATWTDFIIRWYNDRTEWWVNGTLIRTETHVTPTDPLAVHFNIWAASTAWSTAYNAAVKLATSAATGTKYYLDIDYVKVTTIPLAAAAKVGTGTGLAATYYNGQNLAGATVKQIDPRIDFNWGAISPNAAIPTTHFSASWTGQVQAQYTEAYTFYTESDDGIRLWVNGQELVNNWTDHTAKENTGTINLVAGQRYSIVVQYYQDVATTLAELFWSSPSTPKQLVPQIQLYPNDATPPTISVVTPTQGYTYHSLPTTTGTAATPGGSGLAGVSLILERTSDSTFWNGSAWTATATHFAATGTTAWSWTLPKLADGKYAVQATATSGGGLAASSPLTNFYIANVGPTVTLVSPVATYSYHSLAQASGTASDAYDGVAKIVGVLSRLTDKTYWNGKAWAATVTDLAATGTTNWTLTLPSLADGHYSFQAIGSDYAGNTGTTATADFWIVNQPPVIAIAAPIANKSYTSLVAATGTTTDPGPGVASVSGRLQRQSDKLYWNGSTWVAAVTQIAAKGTSSWSFTMPALAVGSYSFQAVAADYVGNTADSAPVNFTITGAASQAASPLSGGSASASGNSVKLIFTGALNSSASSIGHYSASVSGVAVTIVSATYTAATNTVTLNLSSGALRSGATVTVAWTGLDNSAGQAIAAGKWTGTTQ